MPQPVKFSADEMLDAARTLVLSGGPAAASARAVCRATGASSGSVYHRFPRRDDLVAAAWLRAQDRFLGGYLSALQAPGAGVRAALSVLIFCRTDPLDAALLLRYALRDLLRGETSPALAQRARDNDRALGRALAALADATGLPVRDVVLAVVDLPYAVARRTLPGGGPADEDVGAVERAVTLLLARPAALRSARPASR